MSALLDLNYLPLVNQLNPDASSLPGLHIASRPRQAARGRQDDRLILYLTLVGDASLTPERQNQLLPRLAQTYYKTSGSVTGGLRNVAAVLNQFFLDRNLRAGGSGEQTLSILNQAVVREERLYIAHSGPAHTFLIAATGAQHFHDPELSGRGLGFGKTFSIRFFQAELKPNDSFLLTPQPLQSWSIEFLTGLYGQGPESMRRRLSSPDLEAALVHVRKGAGKVFLLRPKPTPVSAAPAFPSETTSAGEPDARQEPELAGQHPKIITLPSQLEVEQPVEPASSPTASKQPRPNGFPPIWTRFWKNTGAFFTQSGKRIAILASRMLPGEMISGISSSVLAFFALAIPLVVVTVATLIYFRNGRANQYEAYLQQAQQAMEIAKAQSEPQQKRAAWQNVLAYLDQVEIYGRSSEISAIRAQAQQTIDELEGVKRLNYIPALNPSLPDEVQIVRLAATDNELFILNATDGSLLRAISVANGYDRDETFVCNPGVYTGINIGRLIDFETLPKGNQLTSMTLAIDANGGILNCAAGEDPKASQLRQPPNGFGKLQSFTLDLGNLYVLDPQKNAVWIYWKRKLDEEPELFFTEEIPPMADVIDLAVNESDLYLLHADGHMTMCTYSHLGVSPTRCVDPLNYIDSRPGYENTLFIPETPFTQILATQPPDPSLYLFEPNSQAVYHFSLRQLTLHRQYRPNTSLYSGLNASVRAATAFTVSADNRFVFVAIGNLVEFASIH